MCLPCSELQQSASSSSTSAVFHTPGVPWWGHRQPGPRRVHPKDHDVRLSIGMERCPWRYRDGRCLGLRMLKLPPKSPNSGTSLSLFGIPLPGFYHFHSFFFFFFLRDVAKIWRYIALPDVLVKGTTLCMAHPWGRVPLVPWQALGIFLVHLRPAAVTPPRAGAAKEQLQWRMEPAAAATALLSSFFCDPLP